MYSLHICFVHKGIDIHVRCCAAELGGGHLCACIYVRVKANMYVFTCVSVIHIHVYIYVRCTHSCLGKGHVCMCVCDYICVRVYVCAYIYICVGL